MFHYFSLYPVIFFFVGYILMTCYCPRFAEDDFALFSQCHWIGLRENLQETMVFTIKYRVFL
jgi:hypothetical protein